MSGNPESSSGVLQINTDNVYKIFECNELVIILFCGCYPNQKIKEESILEEVYIKTSELYSDPGRVFIAKSYLYDSWSYYYTTSKHNDYPFGYKPSVRLFISGKLATKSFSADGISVSTIVPYIQNLLDNSVQKISSICIPNNPTVAYEKVIIGYFKNKNSPEYEIFKKLSMVFMSDCRFYAGFGEEYCTTYPDCDPNKSLIIFKISNQPSPEFEQDIFRGDSLDYDSLYDWGKKHCLYSTSEITFDNADAMRKDRPISLILFYNPDDLKPVKRFKAYIKTELNEYCDRINFLTANGAQISKKLQEIDKSQTDLPFLLLVRNDTIYQFPKHYDVSSVLSYQQLKTLLKDFFSNNYKFYKRFYNKSCDKSTFIHPVYRFNLFCILPNKSVKINRNCILDSAEDNFCVTLFDE